MNLTAPRFTTEKDFDFQQWINRIEALEAFELETNPPDKDLLSYYEPEFCARHKAIPWRQLGRTTIFLIHHQSQQELVRNYFKNRTNHIVFITISEEEIAHAIDEHLTPILLERAHNFCPKQLSIHSLYLTDAHFIGIFISCGLAAFIIWKPVLALQAFMLILSCLVLGNSFLRFLAILTYAKKDKTADHSDKIILSRYPKISLLVPLFREPEMAKTLISNLEALDYPHEALDIKLVIEADDAPTIAQLNQIKLPHYFEIIKVPADWLRTKPKAMNYALPYCLGEIVGVYDAEDCPDPNQLKKIAKTFAISSEKTACVQCELDFYNPRQNWFTRCFTIEYRIWFSMILPALQRYDLPIPLGGTSVFFKRNILEKVGAWDAFNVTEDADLGVRLKRMGYETAVIKSVTLEEANSNGFSWIRQRSRWLKGYMMSWLNHMRQPMQLKRNLGWKGFLAVQVLFLGGVGNYLAIPIFWLVWPSMLGFHIIPFADFSYNARTIFFTIMLFSQAISMGVAYLALKEQRFRHLMVWWLTLPFYWPFGSIASYKALFEMIFRPYYWDKTKHGRSQESDQETLEDEKQAIAA